MNSIFDLDAEYNRSRVIKDLDTRDVEIDKLKQQLATLREAGEKMAQQLRALRSFQTEIDMRGDSSIIEDVEFIFNSEDAAALEAWEAANK